MGKIRELFSDTLVYGISSIAARFINYLLVPFYTMYFNPAEFGIIGLIYGAIVFLNVLFTFGMESSYLRYGAERERSRDIFTSIQATIFGGASLLVLVSWLLLPVLGPLLGLDAFTSAHQEDISGPTAALGLHPFPAESLFFMVLAILWLDALTVVPFAELRLVRKTLTYALIRLGNVVVNVTLNLYLVIQAGWGIEAVLAGNLVASLLTALVLGLFTRDLYRGKWRRKYIQRALWFGIPYIPAGLSHAVNEVLSRFAVSNMSQETVSRLYGPHYNVDDITGIFNACIKLSVFMLLAVQMFRMAWLPFLMRQSESADARKTFAEVFTLFNLAAAVVFIGVGLFVEQLVQVRVPLLNGTIIDSRYWMGLHIVPWLLMAYWFQGWFLNFMAGVFVKEKMWYFSIVTMTGAFITFAGNILLVPGYGMQGAVIVTLLCYVTMAILIYAVMQRIYPVPYNLKKNIAIVLFSGAVVAAGKGFGTDIFEPLFAKIVLLVVSLGILSFLAINEKRKRKP